MIGGGGGLGNPGGVVTKNKLELERLRAHERMHRWDSCAGLCKALMKWGALVVIAVFGFYTIRELAGRATSATLSGLLDLRADRYILIGACALLGGSYYFAQKRGRRVIRGHASYIKELELRIDPGRSSSKLLSDGETRKEDRDD